MYTYLHTFLNICPIFQKWYRVINSATKPKIHHSQSRISQVLKSLWLPLDLCRDSSYFGSWLKKRNEAKDILNVSEHQAHPSRISQCKTLWIPLSQKMFTSLYPQHCHFLSPPLSLYLSLSCSLFLSDHSQSFLFDRQVLSHWVLSIDPNILTCLTPHFSSETSVYWLAINFKQQQ